jgi:hypothetical protein
MVLLVRPILLPVLAGVAGALMSDLSIQMKSCTAVHLNRLG